MNRITAPMIGGTLTAPLLSIFVIPAALRRRATKPEVHTVRQRRETKMKLHVLLILSLATALSACGQKSETNATAATNTAGPVSTETKVMSGDMGNMNMSPDSKMAKGTGKVTAVDRAGGTITLDHGPIAEANWPAMTMAFKAAPALIDSVKVGDEVAFDLRIDGSAGEIRAISKK